MKNLVLFLLALLSCIQLHGATDGSVKKNIEDVYLHFDNSAYILGEKMRFAATVIAGKGQAGPSKVLYVELLAPEGYVVDTHKYKISDGRCSGEIDLRPSLLSGLYELRAYTRAMVEDGRNGYFTRVIPVLGRNEGGAGRSLQMYDRKREGYYDYDNSVRPLSVVPATVSSGAIAVDWDDAQLVPSGTVRLTLKGEPGARLSLSVTDRAGCVNTGEQATIADFMSEYDRMNVGGAASGQGSFEPEKGITVTGGVKVEGRHERPMPGVTLATACFMGNDTVYGSVTTDSAGRFRLELGDMEGRGNLLLRFAGKESDKNMSIGVDKWFSPAPRVYTQDETAMVHIPGVELVKPVVPTQNSSKIGITHTPIHTTFADETEWARAHGIHLSNGIMLLNTMFKRWGYPFGSPYKIRFVSVKGSYPGDDKVPDFIRIYDGMDFDIEDYGDVIIRTDSAACEAFAYSRHAPYYDMGQRGRHTGMGSRSSQNLPTGMPSVVVFMVRKSKAERMGTPSLFNTDWCVSSLMGFTAPAGGDDYENTVEDNKRVLYWNPDIRLDAKGEATMEFHNSSSCRNIAVSAEGITADGKPMVYKAN